MRPVIGVVASYDYDKGNQLIGEAYLSALREAGALPIILPLGGGEEAADAWAQRCDALLLSGGPDVDPVRYGELTLTCCEAISPLRDDMELSLARRMVALNKPVLGICRGIQALNVALRGTLVQDIPSQFARDIQLAHSQPAPRWHATHCVKFTGEGRLGAMLYEAGMLSDRMEMMVNSFHHQCIKGLGNGLRVVAHAPDGVPEAVEHMTARCVVGVQWHPEDLTLHHEHARRLFDWFVKQCLSTQC